MEVDLDINMASITMVRLTMDGDIKLKISS